MGRQQQNRHGGGGGGARLCQLGHPHGQATHGEGDGKDEGEGERGSLADRQASDGDVLWRRADRKADGEGVDPIVTGDCEGEGEGEGDEQGLWHRGSVGGTGICVRVAEPF